MRILGLNIARNRANSSTNSGSKHHTRGLDSQYISLLESIKNGTTSTSTSFGIASSMSFAAVFRAAELRSETVASLPIQIIDINGNKRTINDADPLRYLLSTRPNTTMNAITFWQTFQLHVDLWGDGFAKIVRDGRANPIALQLQMPWETDVIESDGALFYKFKNERNLLFADDVIHVAGIGFDGVRGKSRIQMHRETVAGGLAATKTNTKFWENGAFFRGVLEMPGFLEKQGKAAQISADFVATWGGNNSWGVPVLHGGAKFTPISMPHRDAQYIEGIKFTVEEVARIFNVPLHKMKSSDGANYAGNVEQMQIEWVVDTVRPMVKRIENELEVKLLPKMAPKRIKFNIDALLRGDLKTRASYYKDLFFIGSLSPNEIRNHENMNDRVGGDEYFTPVNMVDAEQLKLTKDNLKNE